VYYLLSNYFILLSVGTEFTQNLNLVVLIFIILHSIYLVYYINKSKYEHYLLDVKLKDDLNKSKNLIDNLNLGIVVFDLNKADTEYNEQYIQKILIDKSFTNQKAKELYLKISIFADLEIYDNEVTMELKRIITDKNINIGIMLNKISEYEGNLNINNTINNTDETQQIILNDDGIFKELENTINDFIKELSSNVKFNDFKFLGTRRNEKILNVYIRKNNINGSLELLISDISSTIKYEEIKNKNKYTKLFLNKFSHEFRNPLLNIIQLINTIKHENLQNVDFVDLDCYANQKKDGAKDVEKRFMSGEIYKKKKTVKMKIPLANSKAWFTSVRPQTQKTRNFIQNSLKTLSMLNTFASIYQD